FCRDDGWWSKQIPHEEICMSSHRAALERNSDELLVLAAVGDPPRSLAAWTSWLNGANVSALRAAEVRTLPRVYRNLRDAGVADSEIPQFCRDAYRSMFVRTRLLMRDVESSVATL